jgi:hypothetical protein
MEDGAVEDPIRSNNASEDEPRLVGLVDQVSSLLVEPRNHFSVFIYRLIHDKGRVTIRTLR